MTTWGWKAQDPALRERGASLTEYAVVFALVAVVSLVSIDYLADEGEKEVNNQVECVESRPPPPGCQIPSVTTSTVADVSATTVVPSGTPDPETSTATWGTGNTVFTDATQTEWYFFTDIIVTGPAPGNAPAEGSLVSANAQAFGNDNQPLGTTAISCQIDATGTCQLRSQNVNASGANRIVITITNIQSNPSVPTYPLPKPGIRPT